MNIKDYVIPSTLEEAYQTLNNNKNSVILGGGAFLRLGNRQYNKVIDLANFKLNYISENDEKITIGAMTSLREVENSQIIGGIYSGILSEAVGEIMGVQLRNQATIGGSVAGKYGFSDILTPLSVMNASVELYKNGIISIEDYINTHKYSKDIILAIIIEKKETTAIFKSLRLTSGDFSTLNIALSKDNSDKYEVAVGARPSVAKKVSAAMDYLNALDNVTIEDANKAAKLASDTLDFQSNIRASEEYRKTLTETFIKRAIIEINSLEAGEQ